MTQELLDNGMPKIQRFITDHDESGKAVFSTALKEDMPWQDIHIARFGLGYATNGFPVDFQDRQDIKSYEGYLENKPGISIPGGTVLRTVDIPPGSLSPMHRTVSLDYGVVLEGEVELTLDSGERRVLRRGDMCVQRGTNHAWRNMSNDKWARMLFVLQESNPVTVNGESLGEDYGSGMPETKASEH